MTGDASCQGKKRYSTYGEAKHAVNRLNRYRHDARGNPYRCSGCNKFHVGNSTGKIRHYQLNRKQIRERLKNGRITFSD